MKRISLLLLANPLIVEGIRWWGACATASVLETAKEVNQGENYLPFLSVVSWIKRALELERLRISGMQINAVSDKSYREYTHQWPIDPFL